jgi:hypothetical protein
MPASLSKSLTVSWLALASVVVFDVALAEECPAPISSTAAAVPTEARAVELAMARFAKEYGAEECDKARPYHAKLEGGAWHVYGNLPARAIGGTLEALLCQADGRVMRVYRTQ